jgi:hypothetical protein
VNAHRKEKTMTELIATNGFVKTARWPDPPPEMLATREFEAVWQAIKSWDINVPDAYSGYMGATGNHVRAILDALCPEAVGTEQELKRLRVAELILKDVLTSIEALYGALALKNITDHARRINKVREDNDEIDRLEAAFESLTAGDRAS